MAAYLDELMAERAAANPEAPLMEFEGRAWTYAQTAELVERGAGWLAGVGVKPGDRVLVLGDNSDGFVIGVLATLRAGAIFVPISPHVAGAMLPFIVAIGAPGAVFADAGTLRIFASQLSGLARRTFADLMTTDGRGARVADIRADGRGEDACIIFTSGSTGTAHGVLCTHPAILAAIHAINATLDQRADDRILCVLPFSFDYGLYQLFLAIACGASIVIASAMTPIAGLPRLLVDRSITVFPIVPALSVMLLRSRMLERLPPERLRLVTSTGDLLSRSQQDRLRNLLGEAAVVPMYGLTECKRVAILTPEHRAEAPLGSVGLPLPGTQVALRPLDGGEGPPEEWGELFVQGPHLMAGYWRDPATTSARFAVDPQSGVRTLRSGDVFARDRSGFLTFLGRAEALGQWRGRWIFPAPLEDRLADLPGVDQAVLAITRQAGEIVGITAYLSTLTGNASIEVEARSIIADICSSPPDFSVHRVPKLPYTVNGKIDRIMLARERAS